MSNLTIYKQSKNSDKRIEYHIDFDNNSAVSKYFNIVIPHAKFIQSVICHEMPLIQVVDVPYTDVFSEVISDYGTIYKHNNILYIKTGYDEFDKKLEEIINLLPPKE